VRMRSVIVATADVMDDPGRSLKREASLRCLLWPRIYGLKTRNDLDLDLSRG
jgi:hypothetical protein